MPKIAVFPDQIYTRLTVIERVANDKRGRPMFRCRCSCPLRTSVIVASNALRTGNTRSCGCLKNERKAWRKPMGVAAAWSLYSNYKHGAKRRQIPFKLTFTAFKRLCQKSCFYCGTPPSQTTNVKGVNGQYRFTGLDLVVKANGYASSNVVPSCWQCNRARRTLPVLDFIAHIRRIHDYQLKGAIH